MTERREATGGLRSQLRNLAEQASFDGEWMLRRPQRVRVQRDASLPGEADVSLRVGYSAERYTANSKLLTRYVLNALLVYEALPAAFVSPEVHRALQTRRLQEWREAEQNNTALIAAPQGEEDAELLQTLLYQDILATDDETFRFERSVDYMIDGRGQVLSERRSERFYDEEGVRPLTEVSGTIDCAPHTISLEQWAGAAPEHLNDTPELVVHPDLRKLEYKLYKKDVRAFVTFAELANRVEQDDALIKSSQRARQHEALSLVAFLHYDISASEILETLR